MDKNEVWSLDFLSMWVSLLFDNIPYKMKSWRGIYFGGLAI